MRLPIPGGGYGSELQAGARLLRRTLSAPQLAEESYIRKDEGQKGRYAHPRGSSHTHQIAIGQTSPDPFTDLQ